MGNRVSALIVAAACLCFGQQAEPERAPVFQSETELVLVPFSVVRGKYFALDVKPEDVVLLEGGKPRAFTIFEGPGTGRRPPLELVLLFDTTTLPPPDPKIKYWWTHWDRQATYEFTQHWGDAESRAVLEKNGADVRVSVYRYDHQLMQRICRSTKDPQTLTRAIHRLPEPLLAEEAIPLTLPPGRMTQEDYLLKAGLKPRGPTYLAWPISWTMEAIIAAVKDSAGAPGNALRTLVVFSEGWASTSFSDPVEERCITGGATTTTVQDAAEQANALGIAVYPVVLDTERFARDPRTWNVEHMMNGELLCMANYAKVGELTGGQAFYPPQIDAARVDGILEGIRNIGLSQYVVGFAPPPSGRKQTHKLEVRLKSKSSGKLEGGKRTVTY